MTAGRSVRIIAVFLLVICQPAFAQFAGRIGWQQTWTDNVFLVADPETDWISQPYAELEWMLPGDVTPYYRGDGYLYANHTDLHAYVHQAGLAWDRQFQDGLHGLTLDGFYRGSLHGPDAADLDYHEGAIQLDLRFRPQQIILIGPSVAGSIRSYPRADELSFFETGGGMFANVSFSTGTTVRVTGRLDYKRFLQDVKTETVEDDDTQDQAGIESANGSKSPGPGPGPDNPDSGDGPKPGPGPGDSDSDDSPGPGPGGDGSMRGTSGNEAINLVGNEKTLQAAQTMLKVRLAQSFPPRVGSFLEGWYSLNLLDPPRYAEGAIPELDREIFDDHYAYEGPGVMLRVTILLPQEFQLRLDGSAQWRRFVDRPARDADGALIHPLDNRFDQLWEGGFGLSYEHGFKALFPAWIGLELKSGYLMNLSNDEYYDSQEVWVSGSIAVGW